MKLLKMILKRSISKFYVFTLIFVGCTTTSSENWAKKIEFFQGDSKLIRIDSLLEDKTSDIPIQLSFCLNDGTSVLINGSLVSTNDYIRADFGKSDMIHLYLLNQDLLAGDTISLIWTSLNVDDSLQKKKTSIYMDCTFSTDSITVIKFECFGFIVPNDDYFLIYDDNNSPIGEFVLYNYDNDQQIEVLEHSGYLLAMLKNEKYRFVSVE